MSNFPAWLAIGATVLCATAAASQTLPLKPGVYAPGTPHDAAALKPACSDPGTLTWTGRGFVADYVYIDHVVKVESLGGGVYRLTSRTETTDENTRKSGKLWLAEIKLLGGGSFQFKQYSVKEPPAHETFNTYSFCKG